MSNTAVRAEILVTGVVQGVFFRASTMEVAQGLNLVGFVENIADGRVEVVAEGPRYALEYLFEWVQHGPPAAEVQHVEIQWKDSKSEFQTFMIRR